MTLCGEHLYLSEHNTIFSCSVEELLRSCKPAPTYSFEYDLFLWRNLPNIPVTLWASLTTLRGQVLSIGGNDKKNDGVSTGAIHRYDRSTNSWIFVGEMPTPRYRPLVTVLPSNELIAVGGRDGTTNHGLCEIASYTD